MLEAVSKMLELKGIATLEIVKTKVECAKTMLDGVILGIKPDPTILKFPAEDLSEEDIQILTQDQPSKIKLRSESEVDTGKYLVTVDEDNKLALIKGLPLSSLVEINGIKMTHKEAIGKEFKKGKIL